MDRIEVKSLQVRVNKRLFYVCESLV